MLLCSSFSNSRAKDYSQFRNNGVVTGASTTSDIFGKTNSAMKFSSSSHKIKYSKNIGTSYSALSISVFYFVI